MELLPTGTILISNSKYTKALVIDDLGQEFQVEGYQNIGKCFHGDKVKLISGKVEIIESKIKSTIITGVLQLYSKYKFPTNRRGIERFKFVPLEKCYPEFLVVSRSKRTYAKNVIATIKFLSWTEKMPYGELVQIIGVVNQCESLYEGLLWKHRVVEKYPKLSKTEKDCIANFQAEGVNYDDLTSYPTISIDPQGCLDIDDAFSWKIDKETGKIYLGIHISDVVGSLGELGLSRLLHNLSTSVYAPHRTQHMFSTLLSQGALSLLPNKKRLTITLLLEIVNNQIVDIKVKRCKIINQRAYSYEEFEKEHFYNSESPIYPIVQTIKNLRYSPLGNKFKHDFDSHRFIEKMMIIYNCEIVRIITEAGKTPIYRVHQLSDDVAFDSSVPRELSKFLSIIRSRSAIYTFDKSDTLHGALGLKNYTHFTSPIRRYVDCYNHKLVHNIIEDTNENLHIDLPKINKTNCQIKKMEREMAKVVLSSSLIDVDYKIFKGYIYQINEKRLVDCYLPLEKLNFRFRLNNTSLDEIIEISEHDKNITIKNKNTGKEVQLVLYKCIEFSISSVPNSNSPYRDLVITVPIMAEVLQ